MAKRLGAWVGLVGALVLGACQPEPSTGPQTPTPDTPSPQQDGASFEPRSSNAPRAQDEAPEGMAFIRYGIDLSGNDPEICLSFSQALDPQVDYSAYVVPESNQALAYSVEGSRLCLGGLGFGAEPTLTLREGLPAASGEALERTEEISVFLGQRPAYVGFSSDGVILPRRDADGLGLETVNVDTLDITLSRVNDRALYSRAITAGSTLSENEWGWLYGEDNPSSVHEVIWEGQMDVDSVPNTPVTTVFPLAEAIGELEPGAYFIQAANHDNVDDNYQQPARTMRWLIITDLAFTAYRSEAGLDLVVRSLQTAQPVSNVAVHLVAANNEILAEVRTDRQGRARFEAPLLRGEGNVRARYIMGYGRDNDFAVLDLSRNPVDLSEQGIDGRMRPEGADGFTWLDRGIYRPGERVYVGTLLRDSAAKAISNRPGVITLYGPNGLEMARHRFERAEAAGAVFWDYTLADTAARGEWRLTTTLDGQGVVASTQFSVEDFVPQRISVDLSLDDESPLAAQAYRPIETDVQFLYGAPGAGLTVQGRLRIEADPNPFPAFEGFDFGRHDEAVQEVSRDLQGAVTDGAGLAVIGLQTVGELQESSHPLRARAVITALEPGGRPVSDDVRIPYRPREGYLGLKPNFEGRAQRNESQSYQVVSVDRLGEARPGRVRWQLIELDWEYDWYRENGSTWRWRRTLNRIPVETGVVDIDQSGIAEITMPGLNWGDYALDVQYEGDDTRASQTFWVGWGSRVNDGVEAPDRVRVSGPDQPSAVGETIDLTIQAPYAGLAEVVIATDRVLESRSIEVPEGGTQVSLTVDEDWGAGAYALVSVYTPRDAVTQPRPRRAVGVSYLDVDTSARDLDLAFDMEEVVTPRQPVTVSVTAQNAPVGEAYIVLAAVDEGILALTRFQSPDPVGWYFGKTALDVALHDDYGRLLDPNQGAAAPIRSGGDQIGGAGLSVVPTKTVALYSGPVAFNRQGEAEIELDLPDFNGQLRLMAVAWSEDQLGMASQALTVRDDVPAEAILPRFLAPGDVAQATLTLDNVEGSVGGYLVAFEAEGAASALVEDRINLAAGERRDLSAEIAGDSVGITEVGLAVSGPEGFSVDHRYPLEVRSAFLPITESQTRRVNPGESWTADNNVWAPFVEGSAALTVSTSSGPLDGQALMSALSRYPYGCTEQTLSRALPLLYAWQLDAYEDPERRAEVRQVIQSAIETLLARQDSQGIFGLWRMGDGDARPWIGVYATDFLARAKTAGFAVPDEAMERAYAALTLMGREQIGRLYGYRWDVYRWRNSNDREQKLRDRTAAYALYVLAREGRADRSRLRYIHDERLSQIENPLALGHIAAGLAYMGDQSRAHNAFERAENQLGYDNTGDWYQSPRRDLAGLLALAAETQQVDLTGRLSERVGVNIPEPSRLTTQEKAFLVMAYWAMNNGEMGLTYEVSGLDGITADGSPLEIAAGTDVSNLTLTNTSALPLWVTQTAHGAPASVPAPAAQGLSLTKTLYSPSGQALTQGQFRQGDRVVVEITLQSTEERIVPAIVEDLLPAGFEIEAVLRPADGAPNGTYRWLGAIDNPKTAEKRDDRFVAAIDLRSKQSVRLAYVVRAITPGQFTLPAVYAEDMYRPNVFARTEVNEIRIAP